MANSFENAAPSFVEPARRPLTGGILLVIYITLLMTTGLGVYRIGRVMSLVADSEPIPSGVESGEMTRIAIDLASTRRALWEGPHDQRIDILRAIGSPGLPADYFLDDLQKLIRDKDPIIASEAIAAVHRL